MRGEPTLSEVEAALAGDDAAVAKLVHALTPAVQGRVARCLLARRDLGRERPIRQEVEDLAQDVFLQLFADNGKVLRTWQPERGLGLPGFAALVAERATLSFLRSGRKSAWKEDPTEDAALDSASEEASPELQAASREELGLLLARLKEELSPLGRHYFQLLFVDQLEPPEVMARTGASADSVYAWRSRLRKLAGRLFEGISEKGRSARTSS